MALSQIPFVAQLLESDQFVIDNSIDPLTVVARGACIFGLSQRVPQDLLGNLMRKWNQN